MNSNTRTDRVLGSMVGLAVGDALGAPFEGSRPQKIPEDLSFYREDSKHDVPAGGWTDDTSMALCMAASIVTEGRYHSESVMGHYDDWGSNGHLSSVPGRCVDIGQQVKKALDAYRRGKPVPSGRWSQGNGAIMRLDPAAILMRDAARHEAVAVLAQSAVETHPNSECADCAAEMGLLLIDLFNGRDVSGALDDWRGADRPENSPWVRHTLDLALWCVANTQSFDEAVTKSVRCGHDTDTNAAVVGQIAGAMYGLSGIPEDRVTGLMHVGQITRLAVEVMSVAHREP